jgi:ElaB/YqjD/DUF883 family membrane-anchored ribosome-binding protein
MEKQNLNESWDEIKEEISKTWTKLTKEDLNYIKGDLSKLRERLHDIYDGIKDKEIEEKLNEIFEKTSSKIKKTYEDTTQKLSAMLEEVKEYAKKGIDTVKDKVPDTFEQTRECIKKNPIQSVIISLALGFIIGSIISPKR